jgi:hypothetical protein
MILHSLKRVSIISKTLISHPLDEQLPTFIKALVHSKTTFILIIISFQLFPPHIFYYKVSPIVFISFKKSLMFYWNESFDNNLMI